mgnify:CR=1 FL=1
MSYSFNGLNQWFLEAQGTRLAHHIKTASSPIFRSLQGETFLQLGIEEHQSWPSGTVIFVGINPCSVWGIPRQRWGHSCMPELVSIHTLRKQLIELGYLINEVKRFIYWPPFIKNLFLERFFEKIGQMIFPYPSGFYLLMAKKQTFKPILNKSPIYFEKIFT